MKKLPLLLFTLLSGSFLKAQGNFRSVDIAIHTEESRWYASPWVWIVGAAIFILLLVVLTNEKKEGNK